MQLNTKTAGRLHNQLVEIEKRTARLDVGQVFKEKKKVLQALRKSTIPLKSLVTIFAQTC